MDINPKFQPFPKEAIGYLGDVIILEPFYEKVTLYLDCPHGLSAVYENIYEHNILSNVWCWFCGETVSVEDELTEKSEPMVFTEYIHDYAWDGELKKWIIT